MIKLKAITKRTANAIRSIAFAILTFAFNTGIHSQHDSIRIDTSFINKNKLNELIDWKFYIGNDYNCLKPNYNFKTWHSEAILENDPYFLEKNSHNIMWFKKTIVIDSSTLNKQLLLLLNHYGASQVYIDGKFIASFGYPSQNSSDEIAYRPNHEPIIYSFTKTGNHTILIRFSYQKYNNLKSWFKFPYYGFHFFAGSFDRYSYETFYRYGIYTIGFLIIFGILLALSMLHFLIYSFYKDQKSNLYYSLFTLSFAVFILLFQIQNLSPNPLAVIISQYYVWRLFVVTFYILVRLVFSIVYENPPKKLIRQVNIAAVIVAVLLFLVPQLENTYILYGLIVVSITSSCTLIGIHISKGSKSHKSSYKIITRGFLIFIYFTGIYFMITKIDVLHFNIDSIMGYVNFFLLAIGTLSIPVSMSIYLAFNFAKTNIDLKHKLLQVETLSAKTIEQERERQRLIEGQKDELEIQVKLRTAEVVAQKEELGHKNKEIIDSITYAKRLQDAILPPQQMINNLFPSNFLIYQPKDIVAGDFYWIHKKGEWNYIAAADSTGHGVPGAMVSIVCSNALAKAVEEVSSYETGAILDKTTELVLETFSKSGEEIKDGMDISLLAVNNITKKIMWSGANNPLWMFTENGLNELKADKQPIGKSDHRKQFQTHLIDANDHCLFILMTDGYADQFGGPNGKKFKYKQLAELIQQNKQFNLIELKSILINQFNSWKADLEQIDDVCVIGIRV